MIFTRKKNIPDMKIYLNGSVLQSCNSYKYLGVLFDNKLSWKEHVDYIVKKISKSCGALAKLRHCVDIKTLVNVYYALVNSYVRYGIMVWGSASKAVLKPLQTIINKSIRIITFAPFGNLDLNPAYKQLKLLTLDKTYALELAKFAFKEKNNLLPTEIGNFFDLSSNQHNHDHFVRNRVRPVRFLCNSKVAEKSVQYKSFELWKKYLRKYCLPQVLMFLKSHTKNS